MNAPLKYLLQDDAANDACAFMYDVILQHGLMTILVAHPSSGRAAYSTTALEKALCTHSIIPTLPKDISIHNFSTPLALSIWSGYVEIKTPAYEQ